jgi:hypothetical protein
MTEPRRWRSGEGGAPDEVRDLLAAGARPRGMSPSERAQAARQAARIAAVPVGVVAWWGAAKALAAGLAVAGVVAGAVAVAERAKGAPVATPTAATVRGRAPVQRTLAAAPAVAPTTPIEHAPAARVATQQVEALPRASIRPPRPAPATTPPPVAAPSPAPAVAAPSEPSSVAPSTPTASPAPMPRRDESLAAEAALLMRAHRGLEGDPARSLALVEAHADFTHPTLAEERELIAVLALERLGRRDEARARGDALIARWPSGAAAQRVRGLRSTAP